MSLPDYVLSEAEDRARTRAPLAPSNISPWDFGISKMAALTTSQCNELRRLGMDPTAADWMWVTVPATDFTDFDRFSYGRAVQHLACPIVRRVRDRVEVITPRGNRRPVYAGGRLSKLPVKPARNLQRRLRP